MPFRIFDKSISVVKQRIQSLTAEYFPLPLKNPFVLSIRTARNANVIRWRLTTDVGREFFGESVPVQYVTGETPESVLLAAPKLESLLYDRAIVDFPNYLREMESVLPDDVAARAGVEIALFNAFSDETQVSIPTLLGGANVVLETDLTIARIPNALDVARAAWQEGFRIFKMKVGGGPMEEDLDRILAIADTLIEPKFRLDANQSLTPESTLRFVEELLRNGIDLELVEQPVPKEDIVALDEIARVSPVPIIADEACRTPAEAFRLFSETAVQGVNVKLMKSGIRGAMDIIRIARAAGRKLMIGCMLEGEIGMAMSVALAASTDAFDYIDLDGHLLLDLKEPISLFRSDGPMLSVA